MLLRMGSNLDSTLYVKSSAQDPFNFDADLDPRSALEKMDPDPDPDHFIKIY